MPRVCASRHDPLCVKSEDNVKDATKEGMGDFRSLIARTLGVLQGILQHQTNQATGRERSRSLDVIEERRVEKAACYMSARLAGRNEDALRLVSDDVILRSSRDGTVHGKAELRQYFMRVKAIGTWGKPTWDRSIGVAQIAGNVRILMVNVAVLAQFGFDKQDRISRIDIAAGRKSKKP